MSFGDYLDRLIEKRRKERIEIYDMTPGQLQDRIIAKQFNDELEAYDKRSREREKRWEKFIIAYMNENDPKRRDQMEMMMLSGIELDFGTLDKCNSSDF